jgi:dTDP-4-dehydrorhamnose 3,5-epimerase
MLKDIKDSIGVINRSKNGDERGFLSRIFCPEELKTFGWIGEIKQINHTYTSLRGTVRGMHYQIPPYSEIKLVTCLKGEIFDVVVDLRNGSPTFLKSHVELLSEKNSKSIIIPMGFAHGYQSLSDDVEMLYCHSELYLPKYEAGLNPKDQRLAINWPLPITQISKRDDDQMLINDFFRGVIL